MACIGCGFELSPGFAFCPRCGRRQPTPCPACGFSCEADFTFCPRCGAARSPGPPGAIPPAATPDAIHRDADRRQVTVLFADVSGFTALAERLDPEEVRAFQNALFETLAQAIARYDGFVEKFVGDAVMAVFGAPVAHEDDPERALDAALDMLGRSARLSDRWEGRLGQPVTLHIGVHTGPVVAGSLGNAAGAAYAVTGDTVNTTARLLAAAPGTILVSDATHALTRHRFAFEPARELALRGKSEPVVVHRLLGALAEPRSARGLAAHGLATPLVGRADELNQLLAAFDRMQRSRAQVVSLVGEACTGKSRLIAEFLGRLETDGRLARTAVRRAACSSLGEPTYGIFGVLFREAYHVEPDDSLDVARQKLAAGLQALGARPEEAQAIAPVLSYVLGVEEALPRDFEPEQLQRQIALAACALVERRLQQEPLLIFVEDLHWADAASVDLLRYVADQLADRPLMMLLSHRSDARPPVVARAAQSIIRLAPLSLDETRALVGGLFGQVAGDAFAQVQDFVATRAGGNPLFVEEIVRSLVGKGVLVRQGDRWACTAACDAVDVPPTLHGLLLSRVDRLAADTRRLLQEAAVLGAAADRAGTARLYRKIGGLHWETGDRERASACFASGLERLGQDGNSIERAQLFQEIGRLAFRAGDNVGAIAWAERALAEAAREQETAADPERVREAAATRAHAYNTLGVALARTGRLGEAVEQIEQSVGLAEVHDLLQAACRGYTNLGVLYSSLDPRRSIETCLRGLETAKKVGDLGFQSRLYANLAVAYCALTDRCEAEGVEAAQMAIDLDRRLGLLDHLAVPLIVLGQIHQCHGEHAQAFASYQEALDLAERVGEPQLLFPCYDGLATLYLDAGNQAQAEVYLAKSQQVCERAGLEPDALMVLPFLY